MATLTEDTESSGIEGVNIGIYMPALKHQFRTKIQKELDRQIIAIKFKKVFANHLNNNHDKVVLQIWIEDTVDPSVVKALSKFPRFIPEIKIDQILGDEKIFRTLTFSFCKVQSIDYDLNYAGMSEACKFLITIDCSDVNYESGQK